MSILNFKKNKFLHILSKIDGLDWIRLIMIIILSPFALSGIFLGILKILSVVFGGTI